MRYYILLQRTGGKVSNYIYTLAFTTCLLEQMDMEMED